MTPCEPQEPLAEVFQKSITPYSQALSLHPHLYGGELYKRASELKALTRLVKQLREAHEEAKKNQYHNLPPILEAINDTLNDTAKPSWWTIFTHSIGQTFTSEDDEEEKNLREMEYLTEISAILVQIIRTYRSTDTKFLLRVRLTTLEVESRLLELQKLPGCSRESNETLDYLSSEFRLLTSELEILSKAAFKERADNLGSVIALVKKINQLMQVLSRLALSDPATHKQFCSKSYLSDLQRKAVAMIENSDLVRPMQEMSYWNAENVDSLLSFLSYFPDITEAIPLSNLTTLLMHLERLFVDDPSPDKIFPEIFSSAYIKQLVMRSNAKAAKVVDQMKEAIRNKKDRSLTGSASLNYKNLLMEENDLHNLCAMIHYKPQDFAGSAKSPPLIQKDSLSRMRFIAHSSQPKDLDNVLKSFTADEMATRYFLLQEIILEQFIYWRKHGIY